MPPAQTWPIHRRLSVRRGMLGPMGNLYDYFAAPDDVTAAPTLADAPDTRQFEVLGVKGIDPVVQISTLEALLRDISYEEVIANPRAGMLVSPEAEEQWVVTLSDTVRDALADADRERLAQVAVPWSQTEEFGRGADPEALDAFLVTLAELARDARNRDHHLYCWISL